MGELLGRSLGAALALGVVPAAALGFTGIALANPLAWGCALAYCSAVTAYMLHRVKSA